MGDRKYNPGFVLRRRVGATGFRGMRGRIIGLLVLAGFAGVPAAYGASGYLKPAANPGTLKKAERYYEDGVKLYQRRKYRGALRKFIAAEKACPELFSAGYQVALTYRKMRDEAAAVTQLKKLNGRFPENIIAHNDLGVIYASRKEEKSDLLAVLELETAIRNGENLLRGEGKKIPQVRVDLAMAYANLGALRLKKSKLSDAERSFRKAVEHYPQAFYGHFGLGNVLFAMKRFGEAKAAYRAAQRIEPNNVSVHISLAKCYLFASKKNPRFAIAELKKVEGDSPSAEVFDLLADAYALVGNSKQAIRYYGLCLTRAARSANTLFKIAVLYYNKGDRQGAKGYLEDFVAESPEGEKEMLPTAYKLLGDISREEKDYEKAAANYLKGAKQRKAYFSCYYGLADSYFHLDQPEKAKEYLLLILKGLPKSGSARENELREKASALLKKIAPH